jgi:hypothetical protein
MDIIITLAIIFFVLQFLGVFRWLKKDIRNAGGFGKWLYQEAGYAFWPAILIFHLLMLPVSLIRMCCRKHDTKKSEEERTDEP